MKHRNFLTTSNAFRKAIGYVLPFSLYALRSTLYFVSCVLCLVSLVGCYTPPAPVAELAEAHAKFGKMCTEDLALNVTRTVFPNTLYIYVPVDFDLLQTRASMPNPFMTTDPTAKRQVNFVETLVSGGAFTIQYDITPVTAYPKDLGYQSSYNDRFSTIHSNILQVLTQSFGDLKEGEKPMDFVVLMIVDVRNGIGIKNTFHFNDLKKVMAQALQQDEYAKRYMSEIVGDQKFVDNPRGRGLNFHDITWPEFIAKQITYRINFKYTRSSFPPQGTDTDEILTVVRDTLDAYDFIDVETVRLEDLASGTTETVGKEELTDKL